MSRIQLPENLALLYSEKQLQGYVLVQNTQNNIVTLLFSIKEGENPIYRLVKRAFPEAIFEGRTQVSDGYMVTYRVELPGLDLRNTEGYIRSYARKLEKRALSLEETELEQLVETLQLRQSLEDVQMEHHFGKLTLVVRQIVTTKVAQTFWHHQAFKPVQQVEIPANTSLRFKGTDGSVSKSHREMAIFELTSLMGNFPAGTRIKLGVWLVDKTI